MESLSRLNLLYYLIMLIVSTEVFIIVVMFYYVDRVYRSLYHFIVAFYRQTSRINYSTNVSVTVLIDWLSYLQLRFSPKAE